jgi:hypothetical protein
MILSKKMRYYRDLARFFFVQRVVGFSIPEEPYFDNESSMLFTSLIHNCRFYLEYGSGGSTVLAAHLNKSFISVDTDRFFLKSVGRKIGSLASHQRLVHVDIGLTGPWGSPLRTAHPTTQRLNKWKAYPGVPWRFIDVCLPDLILVDGRFRVACALTCLANLKGFSSATILIDDYAGRPYYHVVEKYAKLLKLAGRMAIFQATPQVGQNLKEVIDHYSRDWR